MTTTSDSPSSAPVAPTGDGGGGSGHRIPITLARLKLRLLANRARSSKGGQAQLAVACLLALMLGGLGAMFAYGAGHARDARVSRDVIVLGATAIAFGWALLPLVSFGSDESLDPNRLVLFPLRRGPLMRGLLLTSFIGPAPATAILIVLGAVIGYTHGPGAALVVVAMLLLLLLSAAAARTLTTALASGLSSRRGRDAMIIVVSVLVLSIQALRFLNYSSDFVERIVDVARWLPPGMLGQAAIDARSGRVGIALLELLPAAVLIPILLRVWASALDRSMTVIPGGQSATKKRSPDAKLPLLFPRLRFLDRYPWGAVAAKELRYLGREPRRKVGLVNGVLVGVGLPVYLAIRSGSDGGSKIVLLATVAGYIAVLNSNNQFGLDGPAMWLDMVAGQTMKTVLIGKNVAVALWVLPIVTVVGVALSAITGGWIYLPAAIVLAASGLGVGLATADVISVRVPIRLPESRSPFAGSGGGQGCSVGLIVLVCIIIQNVLLLPVVLGVAVAFFVGAASLVVVLPLAALYGVVMWRLGLHLATEWGQTRQPEILVAVDPARTN